MVALLVLVVPVMILVFPLAMEWLEVTLLGSIRAHAPGDALLAWSPGAVGTGQRSTAVSSERATG